MIWRSSLPHFQNTLSPGLAELVLSKGGRRQVWRLDLVGTRPADLHFVDARMAAEKIVLTAPLQSWSAANLRGGRGLLPREARRTETVEAILVEGKMIRTTDYRPMAPRVCLGPYPRQCGCQNTSRQCRTTQTQATPLGDL